MSSKTLQLQQALLLSITFDACDKNGLMMPRPPYSKWMAWCSIVICGQSQKNQQELINASNSRFQSAAQQHSTAGQPRRQTKQLLSTLCLLVHVLLFKILHKQAVSRSSLSKLCSNRRGSIKPSFCHYRTDTLPGSVWELTRVTHLLTVCVRYDP